MYLSRLPLKPRHVNLLQVPLLPLSFKKMKTTMMTVVRRNQDQRQQQQLSSSVIVMVIVAVVVFFIFVVGWSVLAPTLCLACPLTWKWCPCIKESTKVKVKEMMVGVELGVK
jgi:heme O synthase-like polyprenyltransferase